MLESTHSLMSKQAIPSSKLPLQFSVFNRLCCKWFILQWKTSMIQVKMKPFKSYKNSLITLNCSNRDNLRLKINIPKLFGFYVFVRYKLLGSSGVRMNFFLPYINEVACNLRRYLNNLWPHQVSPWRRIYITGRGTRKFIAVRISLPSNPVKRNFWWMTRFRCQRL